MALSRLFHWGPITALLIIFSLLLITTLVVLSCCYPATFPGYVNVLLFYLWVACILYNFLKAAFKGPGHVPHKWKPVVESDVEFLQFCGPCEGYKAPRAHHCKCCNRCVLKMDHHCPWINNCVGHWNHKFFALFLMFVVIGCTHSICMLLYCIYNHLLLVNGHVWVLSDRESLIPLHQSLMLIIFFGVGLAVGVTLAVAFLLYYQLQSIMRNETGIESYIVEKATNRERDDVFVYPYDLGLWDNITQVFCWSRDYVGDGITWRVFEGCSEYDLTFEQLQQKRLKRESMIEYVASAEYSGHTFPLKHGMKVCYDSPWSLEESRVPLRKGDVFLATRSRKYWLYGEKQSDHEKHESVVKGWVPSCCLREVYDCDCIDAKKTK